MAEALAKVLVEAKVERVGFEANFTTFGQIDAIDRAIKALAKDIKDGKPVELVPLEDVMANIRKVKDDHEIDLIRKSVGVAEEAFEAIRGGDQGRADGKLSGRAAGFRAAVARGERQQLSGDRRGRGEQLAAALSARRDAGADAISRC